MKTLIKIFIITCAALCLANKTDAQKLAIYNADFSDFPHMTARIYAFDKDGKQISGIDTSQIIIKENGLERWGKKIDCPPPLNPRAISSVLTIDISHSMKDFGRIGLAKNAAKAWINAINNTQSECGVTSFDAFTYLNQELTTDRAAAKSAIDKLQPGSGTNYQDAFLGSKGAINLAKKGSFNRFIIFLTDGEPDASYIPNPTEIIKEAKKNNITIYCISVGMDKTPILQKLADSTGGLCFGNINTTYDAELTYLMILQNIEGVAPCKIEWESARNCGQYRPVTISMPEYKMLATTVYYLPVKALPYIEISPAKLDFGKVPPGQTKTMKIKLWSRLDDATINILKCDNPSFKIKDNLTTNYLITKDFYLEFTIDFTPSDTCLQSARFEFSSDACSGKEFYMYGGVVCNVPPPDTSNEESVTPLILGVPNGGETYAVGADTVIKWSGVMPSDTVSLEYSTNSGKSWDVITDKATGGEYIWKVANAESKTCLIKVGNKNDNAKKIDSINYFGLGKLTAADFSHDDNYAVSRSKNGYLIIWNAKTGKVIKKYENEFNYTDLVAWSSDNKIAIGGAGNNIRIYDFNKNTIHELKTDLDGNLSTIEWNPDGVRLACGDNRGKITIINTEYQYTANVLKEYSSPVQSISWDPNGFNLVSGHSDGAILIWDFTSGQPVIKQIGNHSGLATAVAWSPQGDFIASGGVDQRIIIHDKNGTTIKSLAAHSGRITSLSWNKSGTELLSGSNDNSVKRWTNTGDLLHEYNTIHWDKILRVKWMNDGVRFHTAANDNNIFEMSSITDTTVRALEGHISKVNSISFNPVIPEYVATASKEKKLHIWDIRTGQTLKVIRNYQSEITCISYDPQASRIAVGCKNGSIYIYNAGSGNYVLKLSTPYAHQGEVTSMDWSTDGNHLVTGGTDNIVKVWDAGIGILKSDLVRHTASVLSVDWRNDGNYIASASADKTISIWDAKTYKHQLRLNNHKDSVIAVNWNPKGDSLITGSSDGQIILWNSSNPLNIELLKDYPEKDSPLSLKWNPNKNILVSAGGASGALLWDTDYGFIMTSFPMKSGSLNLNTTAVSWNTNGKKLLEGSDEGTFYLYNFNDFPQLVQSDQSDKVWSIVSPKIVTRDVFMGNVKVGKDSTKAVYSYLFNSKSVPVRVDSIKISGSDFVHFEMKLLPTPAKLNPFEIVTSTFTFHPLEIGPKSCTITTYTQNETLVNIVSGIGIEANIHAFEIDFGEVELDSTKDSSAVLIKNTGNLSVPVKLIKKTGEYAEHFIIENSSLQAFDLKPNLPYPAQLSFNPKISGELSCNIEYYVDDDPYPTIAVVKGKGVIIKPTITSFYHDSVKLSCQKDFVDTIKIQNLGRETLNVSSVEFNENDNNYFSFIENPGSFSLDTGEIKNILVNYFPETSGVHKASIKIFNNSVNYPEYDLDLTGIKDSINSEINPKEIYLGLACPSQEIEGFLNIKNTGSISNTFTFFANDNAITLNSGTIVLGREENDALQFFIKATDNADTLEKIIYVVDNACGRLDSVKVHLIVGEANLFATSLIISSIYGKTAEDSIRITNFSNYDVTIDSLIQSGPEIPGAESPFEILSNLQNHIIKANESIYVQVRFHANDTIPVNTTFILYGNPCGIIKYMSVSGIPLPVPVDVVSDTLIANTGDNLNIPIRLLHGDDAPFTAKTYLNFRLCFNKNVLYPLSDNKGYIAGDKRCFDINIPFNEALRLAKENSLKNNHNDKDNQTLVLNTDNLIFNFPVMAMLGDAENTLIEIDNAYATNSFIEIKAGNGKLTINNICRDGGTRLVGKPGEFYLKQNYPNPADKITKIVYSLEENGFTDISIFNMYGEKVVTLVSGIESIGEYEIETDVTDLPSGTFYYVLRTPTNSITRILTIIR